MSEADDDAAEAEHQQRIADACLERDAQPTGRLGLYRSLVQGNLAAVARRLLPRTAEALDATPGGFKGWFARFLNEAAPRTPYLRDVPGEFVGWAKPNWQTATDLPAFVSDLATYELARFELDGAPKHDPPPLVDVAIDRRLVFAHPRRLLSLAYTVHEPGVPRREPTTLFLHRDEDNVVHVTQIVPKFVQLLESGLAGATLEAALTHAGTPLTPLELASFLAELGTHGALLGGKGD